MSDFLYSKDGLDFQTASRLTKKCNGRLRRSENGVGFTVYSNQPFDDTVSEMSQGAVVPHPRYIELVHYLTAPFIPNRLHDDQPKRRTTQIDLVIGLDESVSTAAFELIKKESREVLLAGPDVCEGMPGGNQARVWKEHGKRRDLFEQRRQSPAYVQMRQGFALNNGQELGRLVDLGGLILFTLGKNTGMSPRDALMQSVAELQVVDVLLATDNFTVGTIHRSSGGVPQQDQPIYTITDEDIEELTWISEWSEKRRNA